jgi:hypothetical protein
MKLRELTLPHSRGHAGDILSNAGYKKLGSGAFATIWHKEGSDQVLKLFDGNDIAYYDFIQLCKSNPNPHFPKFFSKPININGSFKAIKTELLTKPNITSSESNSLLDYTEFREQYPNDDAMAHHFGEEYDDMFEPILKYLNDPTFKEALDLITDKLIIGKGHFCDFHTSNFMSRNGTLVFSDPVTS